MKKVHEGKKDKKNSGRGALLGNDRSGDRDEPRLQGPGAALFFFFFFVWVARSLFCARFFEPRRQVGIWVAAAYRVSQGAGAERAAVVE